MQSLIALYEKHQGKVSDKWSFYLHEYDRLLAGWREKPVRLLEIGIQNGGSLEIWGQFFPNAEMLIGCDINPACAQLRYDDPRITLIVADATSPDGQQKIAACSSAFDLIIDDGSHRSGDIVRTFAGYFPGLSDGGLFIAEDLHCSYWLDFDGGLYHPLSSMVFFQQLTNIVNQEHWGIDRTRVDYLRRIAHQYRVNFAEDFLQTIHSVYFTNSLCVIQKQKAAHNALGKRIVTGGSALILNAVLSLNGAVNAVPNQRENPWGEYDGVQTQLEATQHALGAALADLAAGQTELTAAQANLDAVRMELNVARIELGAAQAELSAARAEQRTAEATAARAERLAAEAAGALAAVLGSTSWRLLEPARRIGRRLPRLARWSRRGLKLAWWILTLQVGAKLRAHRRRAELASAHAKAPSSRPAERPRREAPGGRAQARPLAGPTDSPGAAADGPH